LLNQSHAQASKNQIMKEITIVILHLDFYRLWTFILMETSEPSDCFFVYYAWRKMNSY